jgi:hypothetical protein
MLDADPAAGVTFAVGSATALPGDRGCQRVTLSRADARAVAAWLDMWLDDNREPTADCQADHQ